MRARFLLIILVALAFSSAAKEAEAGATRYAGKKIAQGTTAIANVTADGAATAGGGMTSAGRASGGAIKTGVAATGEAIKATPGLTARGAKAVGKGIAKVLSVRL